MYVEPTEGNGYTLVIEATEVNWYVLLFKIYEPNCHEPTEKNWYDV